MAHVRSHSYSQSPRADEAKRRENEVHFSSWVVLFLIAVSVAKTATTATPKKRVAAVPAVAAELKEL